MKACILLIEGTNCEDDALTAFTQAGLEAEKVHLKQLTGDCSDFRKRRLRDYDILFLPGGWSAGDYVRAGAIFAARLKARLGKELTEYVEEGRPVFGVCNGFQILVESGLLPGFDGISEAADAILTINANAKFQCRPTYIRHENKCDITQGLDLGQVLQIPVAHAEGRLTFGENESECLRKLEDNKQIIFKYTNSDGKPANNIFPQNPNGSAADIAGITNKKGNILGMMPHPERVINPTQQADWTRKSYQTGDGMKIIENLKKIKKS
jgi:phosphoribosylformylglycinamidine synthase subunit PurQ / glutaminase